MGKKCVGYALPSVQRIGSRCTLGCGLTEFGQVESSHSAWLANRSKPTPKRARYNWAIPCRRLSRWSHSTRVYRCEAHDAPGMRAGQFDADTGKRQDHSITVWRNGYRVNRRPRTKSRAEQKPSRPYRANGEPGHAPWQKRPSHRL